MSEQSLKLIEIVIITIISIIYIILLTFILEAYYNDTESMEIRILQLEKRLTSLESKINNYDRYIEAELRTAKIRVFFEDIEKENNTQESGDDKMPCGRKGRPKGSKNIGGRRK